MKKNISQLLKSLKNFQSDLIYKKLNFNVKEWKIHEKKFQINKNLQIILKDTEVVLLVFIIYYSQILEINKLTLQK